MNMAIALQLATRETRCELLSDAVVANIDRSSDPDPETGKMARFALVLEPILGDLDPRVEYDELVPCIETFATIEQCCRRAGHGYIYDALRPLGVWDLSDRELFERHTDVGLRAHPHYQLAQASPEVVVRFEAGRGVIA